MTVPLSSVERDRLAELVRGGATIDEAATQLGRSYSGCYAWARRLGLIPKRAWRPWSQDEESQLAALVADGVPQADIAARLGRTLSGVDNKRAALGITYWQVAAAKADAQRAARPRRSKPWVAWQQAMARISARSA